MRIGARAPFACLAGWLAGAPERAGPVPTAEVVVIADGLDPGGLGEALRLRVPGARVVGLAAVSCDSEAADSPLDRGEAPCVGARDSVFNDLKDMVYESSFTIARIARAPDGSLRVEVRDGEGRVFRRTLAAEIAEPERAAATSLSHLIAAIAEGSAEPEPEVAAGPVEAPPPERVAVPRPAVNSTPPAPAREASPRIEVGPTVGLTTVVGVGRPSALAGWVGSGALVGLELRGRGGLLGGFELRGLGTRDGGLRLGRLRVAAAIGHSLRRGMFELQTRAAVTVEPWWVAAPMADVPARVGAPLLGGAASLMPKLSAALGPRVRVDVGLRVEAAVSVETSRAAAVQIVDVVAAPRFRLGGVELAASAEIGVRWGR